MPLSLPGLVNPHTFSGVALRGASPSRILGLAAWQPQVTVGYGPIAVSVGSQSLVINNAASVAMHVRPGGIERHGQPVLSVAYEDRRWKWRFASVSALFNERLPSNLVKYSSSNHPAWKRSAREIFEFVFNAIGDGNADVSAAPNNVFPRVEWQDMPADRALQWLCDVTWCSLVLDYSTDRVFVVRRGSGASLGEANKTQVSTTARIGALPDGVAVGCGPTLFQSKLLLQAVGLDTDGSIKKIDDLSYKPAGGWADQWPGTFPDVDPDYRHLASRTVWRWFRVLQQASGGLTVPGTTYDVVSPAQYELTPWLVEGGNDPDGMRIPNPAFIQGRYFPQWDLEDNTDEKAHNPAPFTIIPQLNIVEFPYPVWYSSGGYYEPSLYLTTGYRLRKRDGDGYECYRPRLSCLHTPANTKDLVLPHPELWLTHIVKYTDDGTSVESTDDNQVDVDEETTEYLNRATNALSDLTVTDKIYTGLVPQSLDGAIEQSLIEFGHDLLPTTRLSDHHEADVFTYDEHMRRSLSQ